MLVIPNADGTYPAGGEEPEVEDPNAVVASADDTSDPDPNADLNSGPDPEPQPDLAAQLAEEKETRIRLEERLAARDAQPQTAPTPEPEPTVYSRQELRAAVNEGKIDEDQMEDIWQKQGREQINRDTAQLLDKRDEKRTTEDVVDTETAKFIAAYPTVKTVGSPEWQRVKKEYDFLRKLGDPDDPTTELKALRSALGSAERIPERTAANRQTPGEGGGPQGAPGDRPVDIWNRVPKGALRDYYKKQVQDGFKTLDDVKKDIPYMVQRPN